METNKDPVLSGLLSRIGEGVGHLCPRCRTEVVKGYLAWNPHEGGQSRAQILHSEIQRILREEPLEDERRKTLEKIYSFTNGDALRLYYLYQSRATGHLFHFAYLEQRVKLTQSR